MKKLILCLMLVSVGLSPSAYGKTKTASQAHKATRAPAAAEADDSSDADETASPSAASLTLNRRQAEVYSQILGRLASYAIRCDINGSSPSASDRRSRTLENRYSAKHSEWAALDRAASRTFGSLDAFDSYMTTQFNRFGNERRWVNTTGRASSLCSRERSNFERFMNFSTEEAHQYIVENSDNYDSTPD